MADMSHTINAVRLASAAKRNRRGNRHGGALSNQLSKETTR